jgi:glutamate---cysteine ligase / carboxylate-amine ligase
MSPSRLTGMDPADLPSCGPGQPSLTGTEFASGGHYTVGAEEELLLVDDDHQLLPSAHGDVVEAVQARPPSSGTVTKELFGSEIEFATDVCEDGDQVRQALADFRAEVQRAGGCPMAVGLHPQGRLGETHLTPMPRYQAIGDSLAGLLRTPTAALQVHVGMPDASTAITAYRGLRHRLALLTALAAGSPFWHGRDSGFASGRWAVISAYPHGGVPPQVRSWEEYVAVTEAVAAAAELPDYTFVWWNLRVQPRLGTLEVRVMDAQPSLAVAAGLTTLVQGLARHAVERPLAVDLPSEVLAANDFRAARDGLDARIVDVDGTMRPVRELARSALDDARSALSADGLDGPLEGVERLLAGEPEYVRHRRIHAEHGMPALLTDLIARTARGL